MTELDRAIADLADIRSRLAERALFQGFGPAVIGASGLLALCLAVAQVCWPYMLASSPETMLGCWIALAFVACLMIGAEMIARSRRRHGGMSTSMIVNAIEHFLPAGFAGALLAAVFFKFTPANLWMLPGLWAILTAVGIFTAARCLPRGVMIAGAWYFLAGTAALIVSSEDLSLSPWMMGAPFGVGQLLMAVALHFADGDGDGR